MVRKVFEDVDKKRIKLLQDATAIQQKMVHLKPGSSEWLQLASKFAGIMSRMNENITEANTDNVDVKEPIISITLEDVIETAKNSEAVNKRDIIDSFLTLVREKEDDARYVVEQHMNNILTKCK